MTAKCVRCGYRPEQHGDPEWFACHRYEPLAPLWLRALTWTGSKLGLGG